MISCICLSHHPSSFNPASDSLLHHPWLFYEPTFHLFYHQVIQAGQDTFVDNAAMGKFFSAIGGSTGTTLPGIPAHNNIIMLPLIHIHDILYLHICNIHPLIQPLCLFTLYMYLTPHYTISTARMLRFGTAYHEILIETTEVNTQPPKSNPYYSYR